MNDNQKTVKVIHMAPLGSGGISKLTVTINELIADNIQFDYLLLVEIIMFISIRENINFFDIVDKINLKERRSD